MPTVADLKAKAEAIRRARAPYMDYYQDLAEIFLPDRANFTRQKQEGERIYEDIYDGTPRINARDLASALDGLLKPKTSYWFNVTTGDEDLDESDAVKRWLQVVRDRMWRAIYNPKAGFISRSSEVDNYLTVFGHGVLWTQENRNRNGFMFKAFHIRDVGFEEDSDGVVDTLAAEEFLTPAQAITRFGADNLHEEITKAARDINLQNTQFPFAQIVLPLHAYAADAIGGRAFPFKTCVLDLKHEQIVGNTKGGFHEFPAAIPRWATQPGSCYGRYAPAMIALPDALTLQAMGKTLLVGGERAADPPALIPSDIMISPMRTYPGGLSVFDPQPMIDMGANTPIFPWPVATQLPIGRDMQFDYRQQVEAAFFKNVLSLPIEGRQMTATEILERKEEFVRVLGPTFGRLEADYLGAVVERCFGIMQRAGALPPPPEELADARPTFSFQSPIQRARHAIEVAGFGRAMEVLAPIVAMQPEIMDNFDGDAIARDAPDWSGMSSKWLRDQKAVEELRAARAESQAAMEEVAAAEPISAALKNVATAQATTGNVPI